MDSSGYWVTMMNKVTVWEIPNNLGDNPEHIKKIDVLVNLLREGSFNENDIDFMCDAYRNYLIKMEQKEINPQISELDSESWLGSLNQIIADKIEEYKNECVNKPYDMKNNTGSVCCGK